MRRILFIIVFALIITAAGCTRDNKIDELNPAKTESGSNLAEEGTTDENDTDEKTSEENNLKKTIQTIWKKDIRQMKIGLEQI